MLVTTIAVGLSAIPIGSRAAVSPEPATNKSRTRFTVVEAWAPPSLPRVRWSITIVALLLTVHSGIASSSRPSDSLVGASARLAVGSCFPAPMSTIRRFFVRHALSSFSDTAGSCIVCRRPPFRGHSDRRVLRPSAPAVGGLARLDSPP